MRDTMLLKRCAVCVEPVIYSGPDMLRNANVCCSDVCSVIYDQITPGYWIDPAELMRGGCFHNRPDIWIDDLEARQR